MSDLKEISWKEFYDHPGILEAMDQVYKSTGLTLKIFFDDHTGEFTKVVPVKKEE